MSESLETVYETRKLDVPAGELLPAHQEWVAVLEHRAESGGRKGYIIIHDFRLPDDMDYISFAMTSHMLMGADLEDAKQRADEMLESIEARL